MGARARERVLDEHTYAHRARRLLEAGRAGRAGGKPCLTASSRSSRPSTRRRPSPRSSREIRALRPEPRHRRRRRRLDRRHRRAQPRPPARPSSACRSTSASAAPSRPASSTRSSTGYDVAVRLDGDGQHDPTELPKLLEPLGRDEADIVVGSRFAGGERDYRPPLARRAGIRWFAHLVSLLTRQKLTDTTSGFQAVNARGDPAVRRRLPARLPGGRGGRDGRPAPAADQGGAGADARARGRLLVDHDARAPSTTWSR